MKTSTRACLPCVRLFHAVAQRCAPGDGLTYDPLTHLAVKDDRAAFRHRRESSRTPAKRPVTLVSEVV